MAPARIACRIRLPSLEELTTSTAHSGEVSASLATSSRPFSGFWSMATSPMSGLVWATTSPKNSYREHSASSQIMSMPKSMPFSASRDESLGSTIASRRTLLMLIVLLMLCAQGATSYPTGPMNAGSGRRGPLAVAVAWFCPTFGL